MRKKSNRTLGENKPKQSQFQNRGSLPAVSVAGLPAGGGTEDSKNGGNYGNYPLICLKNLPAIMTCTLCLYMLAAELVKSLLFG